MNGDKADAVPHERYIAFTKLGLYLFWDDEIGCWSCPFGYDSQFEDITGWNEQRLTMSGYGQGTYADFDPTAS